MKSDKRVMSDGSIHWYKIGTVMFHNVDGPAVINNDGSEEWWVDGKRHRIDGPSFGHPNGSETWHQNDVLHRLDGPAVTDITSDEQWLFYGYPHRLDGPAIKWKRSVKWYLFGKLYSEQEFNQVIEYFNHHLEGKDIKEFPADVLQSIIESFLSANKKES